MTVAVAAGEAADRRGEGGYIILKRDPQLCVCVHFFTYEITDMNTNKLCAGSVVGCCFSHPPRLL